MWIFEQSIGYKDVHARRQVQPLRITVPHNAWDISYPTSQNHLLAWTRVSAQFHNPGTSGLIESKENMSPTQTQTCPVKRSKTVWGDNVDDDVRYC